MAEISRRLTVANVTVEPRKDGFVALLNGRKVAEGETQKECGENAHEERPADHIQAARTRDTKYGKRDQFRTLYKGNPNA
jgi:hypothetical protein